MAWYEVLFEQYPYGNEIKRNKTFMFDLFIQVTQHNYRPDIKNKSVPQFFKDLLVECWNKEPKKRKTSLEALQWFADKQEMVKAGYGKKYFVQEIEV